MTVGLTPERWREIERLYQLVQERAPGEREAFLRDACAGDEDLRKEVAALLADQSRIDRFIESPAMNVAAKALAQDQAQVTLKAGQTVAHYRVIDEIGHGGMGVVYRAEDTKLRRTVALKFLPPAFASDAERLARFEREARLVASLNHPNIAGIYGLEESAGKRFLVLELVEGETLAQRIARGPLPPDEALKVCRQIAEGLEAAHEKGIIHRDLKPANVQITSEGKVKILDFGLARAFQDQPSGADLMHSPTITTAMTQPGVVLGTAAYMSPEQAKGKLVDKRADICGFGCILYECLTGRRAFQGETINETLATILKGEPDWKALPTATPWNVTVLLRRCLQKDPRQRLGAISDARLEIDDALTAPSAVGGATTQSGPPPTRGRTSWSTWAAVAVLAITAGFGLWKLSASLATPEPRVLRLAVSIPASQGFVDIAGNAVLFTPDGSAIVYSGRGPQGSQLYYRRLDQLEGTALPGTDNACCTAISPSGDWVAFVTGTTVRKVPVRGGAPIELAKVEYQGGLSWGSDDAIFSAEGALGLFRIPANGGPAHRIALPDPAKHESAWYMPMALPDGKTVLVFEYMQPLAAKLAMVRIADGEVTELDGEGENPIGVVGGYLLFGRLDGALGVAPFDPAGTRSVEAVIPVLDAPLRRNSGVEAALSSAGDLVYVKATGRSRITFLDAQGHITGESPDEHNFSGPRMSPNGRQVVVRELTDNVRRGDLWLYDVASGVRQPLTTGVNALAPEWAPDGHRVVYSLRPDTGPAEAWSVPADRSGPAERFIAMPIPIARTVLSPDSRYAVITTVDPKARNDLYLVDLKGDRKPQLLEQSLFNATSPAVSPDGRWLVYVSDESGHDEVYVRPFPAGGAHVQVSADGGTNPRWEKDSLGIVYRNADRFMKARLAIGANVAVTQRDLLFTGPYADYDLSPNGTIVALRPGSADAQIIVVTNWIAELKAKLGKK